VARLGLATALAAVLLLSACAGSGPRVQEDGRSRSGGYYLNDGPPDATPADLDAIPDAQPRAEPIKISTTRPYTALGRRFVPMTQLQPYSATGVASWYGRRYHGRPTASGEPYDMFAMSAAHPLLPIPSYARVTRLDTQRSVVVRINDRGPFLAERLIDLSYAAAYKLGIVGSGKGGVRVDAILPDEIPRTVSPATGTAAASPPGDAIYLQLGAFAGPANAQALAERARSALPDFASMTGVLEQDGFHRVRTGPFASRTEALQAATQFGALLALDPTIVGR
jgi:rare lipoprotein A